MYAINELQYFIAKLCDRLAPDQSFPEDKRYGEWMDGFLNQNSFCMLPTFFLFNNCIYC